MQLRTKTLIALSVLLVFFATATGINSRYLFLMNNVCRLEKYANEEDDLFLLDDDEQSMEKLGNKLCGMMIGSLTMSGLGTLTVLFLIIYVACSRDFSSSVKMEMLM